MTLSRYFRDPPERRRRAPTRSRSSLFAAVMTCARCGAAYGYPGCEVARDQSPGRCHDRLCALPLRWFAVLPSSALKRFRMLPPAPSFEGEPRRSVEWATAELRPQRAVNLSRYRFALLTGCYGCGELVCLPGEGADIRIPACARCGRPGSTFRLVSEGEARQLQRTNLDRVRGSLIASDHPDLHVMPNRDVSA